MADEEAAVVTKKKKLSKDLATDPGAVIITVEGGEKGAMKFPFNKLPGKIQTLFGPFGLGHKLGDSAAGRKGKDAEKAILKVWEGLVKGDWSVRAPAVPKISVTEVAANFAKLSDAEKKTAEKLLAGLGIKIPGIAE
jgi:hypothetical protein